MVETTAKVAEGSNFCCCLNQIPVVKPADELDITSSTLNYIDLSNCEELRDYTLSCPNLHWLSLAHVPEVRLEQFASYPLTYLNISFGVRDFSPLFGHFNDLQELGIQSTFVCIIPLDITACKSRKNLEEIPKFSGLKSLNVVCIIRKKICLSYEDAEEENALANSLFHGFTKTSADITDLDDWFDKQRINEDDAEYEVCLDESDEDDYESEEEIW